MAKVIVWSRPDGGMSFTVPVEQAGPGETEVAWLNRIAAKAQADGAIPPAWVRAADVDDSTLPNNRAFRNAWQWGGAAVNHSVAIAKTLLRDRLDDRFDTVFRKLHVERLKAEGDVAAVAALDADLAAKRTLRASVRAQITAANTIAELRAINPVIAVG